MLLVMASMVTILVIAGVMVTMSIRSFSTAYPGYEGRLAQQVMALESFLASRGIRGIDNGLLAYANPAALMSVTARLLAWLASALSSLALILLTVAFFLLELSSFSGKLRAVLGRPRQVFPEVTRFVGDIERFVVIKTLVSLAKGVLLGGWLAVLGVDFPVLWGFLAFLLNCVPLGSVVAAVPAVLLALAQLGMGRALIAAAGYGVVNFIFDNVVELRLLGQRLHLSLLVAFLSMMGWGALLGPVGLILCIPLTVTLKFACESNESTRWIAVLLGSEVPAAGEPPAPPGEAQQPPEPRHRALR
jgi:predicted PurR-regulated permease PerM